MFLEVATADGQGTARIKIDTIIRFRPSHGSAEPPGGTVIDYADQRFQTSDGTSAIVERIGDDLHLVQLTTPVAKPVFLNATKVTAIREATQNDHELANAVVRVAQHDQAVTESPAEVEQLLASG